MAKLVRADIKVGAFVWMDSIGTASFPAVITRVDEKTGKFYLKTLDNMQEQAQPYDGNAPPSAPESCTSMRLATILEVGTYLDKQEEKLIEKAGLTRRVKADSALTLRRFHAERVKLFPDRLKQ